MTTIETLTVKLDEITGGYCTLQLCLELGRPEPAVTVTLPALEGTPKQVAWAGTLRREAVEGLCARATNSPARARETLTRLGEFQARLQAFVDGRPSAKAWIDAR